MTSSITRPAADEYAAPYQAYLDRVAEGGDLLQILREQRDLMRVLLERIDDGRGGYRYAEGKWSVREVVGHLSDAERIFAVRALRVARGDETPLPGWDENTYAAAADFDRRTIASIANEWDSVRAATLTLFEGFSDDVWERRGTANGWPVSVRAIAWIVAGHTAHHLFILRERYGVGA